MLTSLPLLAAPVAPLMLLPRAIGGIAVLAVGIGRLRTRHRAPTDRADNGDTVRADHDATATGDGATGDGAIEEVPDDRPDFAGAELRKDALDGVDLRGARLNRARIRRIDLSERDLTGADMRNLRAQRLLLGRATLVDADLSWADLHGADLRGADLSGAILLETDLTGADLRGSRLGRCSKVELAHLRGAVADTQTSWPAGFAPESAGVIVDRGSR